jgi:hypothetical protein
MKNKILVGIIALIFLISLTSASTLIGYPSNITFISAGTYDDLQNDIMNGWINQSLTVDKNYNTFGETNNQSGGFSLLMTDYVIPDNSEQNFSALKIHSTILNSLNVPETTEFFFDISQCSKINNGNTNVLRFKTYSFIQNSSPDGYIGANFYYCYTDGGYAMLPASDNLNDVNLNQNISEILGQRVYDQSIYWTINDNSVNKGIIFDLLNSIGAGFGIFLQVLGFALPYLLIGLATVGFVVFIGYSIKDLIKNSLHR